MYEVGIPENVVYCRLEDAKLFKDSREMQIESFVVILMLQEELVHYRVHTEPSIDNQRYF